MFSDFMFAEDQDDAQFLFYGSVAMGDAPQDWTLPSVSLIQSFSFVALRNFGIAVITIAI